MKGDVKKDEVKKDKHVKKVAKLVRMYHGDKSVIDIPETKVQAHLEAGWRLEK